MRSRSLGIIFIAAVIVPSILLAVLSIRSAGREEAWMEKQMAATLDAEVTHTAGLAGAEVRRVIDDLRAALDVPPGGDYGRILTRWKSATALVAVPFMLSPRYGILWPPSDTRADDEQRRFLRGERVLPQRQGRDDRAAEHRGQVPGRDTRGNLTRAEPRRRTPARRQKAL